MKPDLIHAHYGLSGMFAALQLKKPLIITYHGSDLHHKKNSIISSIASIFANYIIFVEKKLFNKILIKPKNNFSIIPCGVNLDEFYPIDKNLARKKLGLSEDKIYIIFSSNFDNKIKNYSLAKSAIVELNNNNIELIELKNKTRAEINLLLNACNLLLITSLAEASPQIVKEAMACNCPIVATDVGDIAEINKDTNGCYLCEFNPIDVADKIKAAIEFGKSTNGRDKILTFANDIIAKQLKDVYQKVIQERQLRENKL